MRVSSLSLPQNGEIQFQLSLLNIACLGSADSQVQELEKLLVTQDADPKH